MNYSLTNPQKSIWFTEKFYSGTAINNISGYTYISEKVNFDILKRAINEVIKTNDFIINNCHFSKIDAKITNNLSQRIVFYIQLHVKCLHF